MANVDARQSVVDAIRAARKRHLDAGGEAIQRFLSETGNGYSAEIDRFVEVCRNDIVLRQSLEPMLCAARDYLLWMQWSVWNAANLAPLLDDDLQKPARRVAPAMLAYAGLRLVDDGLDGHDMYKSVRPTLLGWVRAQRPTPAVDASAFSAFVGQCVFTFGLRRIREVSGPAASREAERLFEAVAIGALAEPLLASDWDVRTYEHLARRKSAAYNLILYKPLVIGIEPALRKPLLSILSDMDLLAQLVNDVVDVEEDRERGQPNAAVQGLYPEGLPVEVQARLMRLWFAACCLPESYRDALAAMFTNLGTDRVGCSLDAGNSNPNEDDGCGQKGNHRASSISRA